MPHRTRASGSRIVIGLAASLVLAACSGGGSAAPSVQPSSAPSSAAAAPTDTPAPSGPPTVGLTELEHLEISLQGGPDFPVALDGSVWILAPDGPLGTDATGPLVYRLDATSGEVLAEVPIGGRLCQGLAAGFGSVWACTDTGLDRIDPSTDGVTEQVAFETAQVFARPAIGADRVWVLGGNVTPDTVMEVDPATNGVVAAHPLGHAAASLVFGGDALWITVPADGLLLRLDPRSGEVTEHASGLPAPSAIAYGAG